MRLRHFKRLVVAAVAICAIGFIGLIAVQLIGRTSRRTVETGNLVPIIGPKLRELRLTSPIYYDIFNRWGRSTGLLSGRAELVSITNFANANGFADCAPNLAQQQLTHVAKAQRINHELIRTEFTAEDAALMSKEVKPFWNYALLRFQVSDGCFTIYFFN